MAAKLEGQDYHQYLRALSFFCYLKDDCLATLGEINSALVFETQVEEPESERAPRTDSTGELSLAKSTECGGYFSLEVTFIDYQYRIADMAGELKRMSVHGLGRGHRETQHDMCRFLRVLYLTNVVEVEKACYATKLHDPSGGETQNAKVVAILPLMEDLAVVDGKDLVEVEGEDLGEVEVEDLAEA
ncbi:hypothetical protein MRX96_008171 [Rhipicephalus microplus]